MSEIALTKEELTKELRESGVPENIIDHLLKMKEGYFISGRDNEKDVSLYYISDEYQSKEDFDSLDSYLFSIKDIEELEQMIEEKAIDVNKYRADYNVTNKRQLAVIASIHLMAENGMKNDYDGGYLGLTPDVLYLFIDTEERLMFPISYTLSKDNKVKVEIRKILPGVYVQ